jgi:uncharacterized protein (DUF983 family)
MGRCPRCGEGRLYAGLLRFEVRCGRCGLDFAAFNVGDGPAAFLILVIGAVVVGLAMFVELSFAPPFWVHAILWLPLVVGGTVGALRVTKGVLLALEWRNAAGEGRAE